MYFANVFKNDPICEINENGSINMLINEFDIPELKGLIIQFKDSHNNFVDFGNNTHIFQIKFTYFSKKQNKLYVE